MIDAAGVPVWQPAGYLGMSTEMLDPVYGHHSPEHLKQAADAITGKRAANVSVVVSVVGKNFSSGKQQKDLQILGGARSRVRTSLHTCALRKYREKARKRRFEAVKLPERP